MSLGLRRENERTCAALFAMGSEPAGAELEYGPTDRHHPDHGWHVRQDGHASLIFMTIKADETGAWLVGGLGLEQPCFQAMLGLQTTAPRSVHLCDTNLRTHFYPRFGKAEAVEPIRRPEAYELTEEIRAVGGLTLEMIARLMGVSTRAIHLWRAGEALSAANATRLRRLTEVVRALHAAVPGREIAALEQRGESGVSLQMLLQEGRFDTALARINGRQPTIEQSRAEGRIAETPSIDTRMGAVPLEVRPDSSRLNRARSTPRRKPSE